MIRGANKKHIASKTNIEFEIFSCWESNPLILLELNSRIGNNTIRNSEIILSITDKLSCV